MKRLGGFPVVKGVSYGLAHAPSLVRHGSKPSREIAIHGDSVLEGILSNLRTFEEAVAYAPNQVYVGNLRPADLSDWPRPRHAHPVPDASPSAPHGTIMPERELYARMLRDDQFDLVWFTESFAGDLRKFCSSELGWPSEVVRQLKGRAETAVAHQVEGEGALPLFDDGRTLVGCVRRAHARDDSLKSQVLLENLVCRTTGVQALELLLTQSPGLEATEIDYLIGCGEEAVGDRYQRGGGNIAKAMGEAVGCVNATGCDIKAFCCSPVHSMIVGGALVHSGVFKNVVVLAGSSLAKLGMKFQGHLAHDMPILEDVLASLAIWIAPDDGQSPQLRLDTAGMHPIGAGGSAQSIANSTVLSPLRRAGLELGDIDKYAVELHDPDVTEPAGSGNVPRSNYRMLAGLAVLEKEIAASQMDEFADRHGMPGFAPTQGHIASAVPFLGHALDLIEDGELERVMFIAKGSLFLGRLTQLSDGASVMIERNSSRW
jgi:betaine reductase